MSVFILTSESFPNNVSIGKQEKAAIINSMTLLVKINNINQEWLSNNSCIIKGQNRDEENW